MRLAATALIYDEQGYQQAYSCYEDASKHNDDRYEYGREAHFLRVLLILFVAFSTHPRIFQSC
jgi:hypothetical protein